MAHSLRIKSLMAGKAWWEEVCKLVTLHLQSGIRERNADVQFTSFYQSRTQPHSGWVSLLQLHLSGNILINIYKGTLPVILNLWSWQPRQVHPLANLIPKHIIFKGKELGWARWFCRWRPLLPRSPCGRRGKTPTVVFLPLHMCCSIHMQTHEHTHSHEHAHTQINAKNNF